jgi:hypothetical protein
MTPPDKDAFFIGWAKPPKSLRELLLFTAVLLIAGFMGLSLVIGGTKPDPGPGAFRFDWGAQTVTGVMRSQPYPTVLVTEGNERIPTGHTLMLSGQGKRGVQDRAVPLEGQLVEVTGVLLKRGTLDMLQVGGQPEALQAAEGESTDMVADEALGRWRLTGEVCDGKCLAGAMRPGTGLSHKACANLCLIGGVPPVFVSAGAVEGTEFLLMANADGGPLDDRMYDLVGRLSTLEGDVVRRGDLLIFQADLATAEFVQ